jgi:hypothetical protein
MAESGAGVSRHRLIQALCAFILLMIAPSASLAQDSTVSSTSVTLQGDADGTGCAIWLEPAQPVRYGDLKPPVRPEDRAISQEFSLRVVNGRAVSPSSCVVTAGGSAFTSTGNEVLSIHALKLEQSLSSGVSVRLVPQLNDITRGELQSILVQSPEFGGCAIVAAILDTTSIPVLPDHAVIVGTVTLTMSDIAP